MILSEQMDAVQRMQEYIEEHLAEEIITTVDLTAWTAIPAHFIKSSDAILENM